MFVCVYTDIRVNLNSYCMQEAESATLEAISRSKVGSVCLQMFMLGFIHLRMFTCYRIYFG